MQKIKLKTQHCCLKILFQLYYKLNKYYIKNISKLNNYKMQKHKSLKLKNIIGNSFELIKLTNKIKIFNYLVYYNLKINKIFCWFLRIIMIAKYNNI
jgi:hypothetical protein